MESALIGENEMVRVYEYGQKGCCENEKRRIVLPVIQGKPAKEGYHEMEKRVHAKKKALWVNKDILLGCAKVNKGTMGKAKTEHERKDSQG